MLHVENRKVFVMQNYFAISAIFPVVFTQIILVVALLVWAHEFGFISDLPFMNLYANIGVSIFLFCLHYYVYVFTGRYRVLAPVLKHQVKNKSWLLINALGPLAVAFTILWGFAIYAFINW